MAIWCSLWSFGIFFPFWYFWTKKNLATLAQAMFSKFFLVQYTKTGKLYQIATKLPNGHNHYKMVVIYSKWP
jgi:hypothetical protein